MQGRAFSAGCRTSCMGARRGRAYQGPRRLVRTIASECDVDASLQATRRECPGSWAGGGPRWEHERPGGLVRQLLLDSTMTKGEKNLGKHEEMRFDVGVRPAWLAPECFLVLWEIMRFS